MTFSVAQQFSQLQVVFSTVHGSSSRNCFLVEFSSWLVSSHSQPSVGTEQHSTSEDGEGDHIEVLSCDDFHSLLFVGTVFPNRFHVGGRWRGPHQSVLRRARGVLL